MFCIKGKAMSNETDLDWLARNVHVWREGANYVCVNHTDGGYVFHEHNRNCAIWFTKDQWLARRAELQNKPSWADHQDAKCFVQRKDGAWFKNTETCSAHPTDSGEWMERQTYGGWVGICRGEVLGDWCDTLEQRPEEFKPFTSIEDNQDQALTQQQDNGWHERGELPPAGERCVLHAKENNGEEVMFIGVTSDSFPVFETVQKRVFVERGEYRFSPIRTERDVLIEIIKQWDGLVQTDDVLADAILAAGFSLRAK